LWNAETTEEIVRITVPNIECNCVAFTNDGKSIISGWSDGKIRAFGPQSGKILYAINDAHQNGVTAIASTSDCKKLISGGVDGQIRVWRLGQSSQVMEVSMKEHKGTVTYIEVSKDDSECVSCSLDGSCIIWDLKKYVRNKCFFAETMFKSVVYHPDGSQIITCGTDRKVKRE
jgi:WD40 repeat protein